MELLSAIACIAGRESLLRSRESDFLRLPTGWPVCSSSSLALAQTGSMFLSCFSAYLTFSSFSAIFSSNFFFYSPNVEYKSGRRVLVPNPLVSFSRSFPAKYAEVPSSSTRGSKPRTYIFFGGLEASLRPYRWLILFLRAMTDCLFSSAV